ncbi:chemotaxis protein CheW [Pseudomonas sp. RIT-PI-S]|uniref:chemotaxis protein CheW n=1 Tax=Pseudomonas sp. RIT-PI-S TaxID=3035295 RepID=UPI0021D9EF12|nr:chemotaxis protein CheW [Pseudomonas sp. RIT-PI-S]
MNASYTAFELLLAIDQRCRARAGGLPVEQDGEQPWSGISFRMGNGWFVAPMTEVAEVLPEPRMTRIPGVKPWVLGVANLRGRLLPVMNLSGYFGATLSSHRRQRRVLVIDHDDLFIGLLVDEAPGLQHFPPTDLATVRPENLDEALAPFVKGYFFHEREWAVFSPFALVTAAEFLNVAV